MAISDYNFQQIVARTANKANTVLRTGNVDKSHSSFGIVWLADDNHEKVHYLDRDGARQLIDVLNNALDFAGPETEPVEEPEGIVYLVSRTGYKWYRNSDGTYSLDKGSGRRYSFTEIVTTVGPVTPYIENTRVVTDTVALKPISAN